MDMDRFDDLAVAVAEGESRRTLLRRLFGGGLAALAAAGLGLGPDEAEADSRKACRQKCKQKRRRQQRRRCRQRCKKRSACKRNPQCAAPRICVNGNCTGGWNCVTDTHCGNGQTCIEGRCQGGGSCTRDSHCRGGQVCIGGICQGPICLAVTRTACANEAGTCGPAGSTCVCLQEAGSGGRIACSEVGFSDCNTTPVCDPANPNACPAGWLCANNPCCPDAPRCLPPCGVAPQTMPRARHENQPG